MANKKGRMIKNLQDYVDMLGGENPYYAGRTLYKNVACGPWTAFIVRDKEAGSNKYEVTIRFTGKSASIDKSLPERIQSFLGFQKGRPKIQRAKLSEATYFNPESNTFDEDDSPEIDEFDDTRKKDMFSSPDAYYAQIKDFVERNPRAHREFNVDDFSKDGSTIHITLSKNFNATTKDINYEDEAAKSMFDGCIGVKIGSIVEGSDVEIGPEILMFPFSEEEFDEAVEGINEQASFYWKRDNLEHFIVKNPEGDIVGVIMAGWGDFDFEGREEVPDYIADEAKEKVKSGELEDLDFEDPVELGGGWTIEKYLNDSDW